MFGLGAGELILIFVIAILFLGPKKLPELAKGLGQAMKEFQKARDDMMSEIQKPAVTEEVKHDETKPDVSVAAIEESDEENKVTKQS